MLSLVWSFKLFHWILNFSGRPGDDAVGSGVMRQVLLEAIRLASEGILEDLDNDDGYQWNVWGRVKYSVSTFTSAKQFLHLKMYV
jgi:hypothetical protein